MNAPTRYRAVVFDLGGVVFASPIDAFRAYEREHGLPDRFLSEVVLADPDEGAWSRLERGELNVAEFCRAFETECAAAGRRIDAAALMTSISTGFEPRAEMIDALRAIRAHGLATAALTNNWVAGGGDERTLDILRDLFDVVVESAVEGMRKPDPRIYELVCQRLGAHPATVVFLDDLGANLKPARTLGMTTIKVGDPHQALADLESTLGFRLSA
jgi:putative hydrolase of the HAD superfamily